MLKSHKGKSARLVEAAVHFVYDIAGRSEDAIGVKWKDISDEDEFGAVVHIKPGKAAGGKQWLTRETLKMLYKIRPKDSMIENNIFHWKTSNSMRM